MKGMSSVPAGIATSGAAAQLSDPAAFVLDFLPFEERAVRRESVRLFNILYLDGALASLLDHPRKRHCIKYNPRDMSVVFVELPGGGHGSLLEGLDAAGRMVAVHQFNW
jgi:hypothetical protein